MNGVHLPDIHALGLTDLMNTDTTWLMRDPDGELRPIQVDDMQPDHRAAVLRWIRANALLMDRHQRRLIAHLHRMGTLTDRELAQRLRVLDRSDPHVWVEDTALVRRLVQLTVPPARPPRTRRLLPARLRRPFGGRP